MLDCLRRRTKSFQHDSSDNLHIHVTMFSSRASRVALCTPQTSVCRVGDLCIVAMRLCRYCLVVGLSLLVTNAESAQPDAATVGDLLTQVNELSATAADLKASGKLDELERVRLQRWDLARQLYEAGDEGTVWAKAYAAIRSVDGHDDAEGRHRPGLIDRFEYQSAYDVLSKAWNDISAAKGELPSEVTARMFEVTHQALGNLPVASIFKGEPGAGKDAFVDSDELAQHIAVAAERDPCGTLTSAMKAFLEKPASSEVFLRIEVRPSLRARQEILHSLAHPAILRPKTSQQEAQNQQPAQNQPAVQSPFGSYLTQGEWFTERGDVPIQPWHAPTEWCRINSLSSVLADLDYSKYLVPDRAGRPDRADRPKYIYPGVTLDLTDAVGNKVELLYGCLLLYRTTDSKQRNRAALSYVNPDGVWIRKYVDVLVAAPKSTDASNNKKTSLERTLDLLPREKEVELADTIFAIKELPPGKSSAFLQQGTEVFCAKNVFAMLDTQYSNTDNPITFLTEQQDTLQSQLDSQIFTTGTVSSLIAATEQAKDPTVHPLRELMVKHKISPLVVVSSNDGMPAEPEWIGQGDDRHLAIADGGRLKYVNAGKKEVRFEVDCGNGVISHFPLNLPSVPLTVLKQCRPAVTLTRLLNDSGYKGAAADNELVKFLIDPAYWPPRAFERLSKRAQATNKPLTEVVKSELVKLDWPDSYGSPREALLRLKSQFGIRYLNDPRGNTALNSEIEAGYLGTGVNLYQLPPFLLVTPSGERVPARQTYSFAEYQQIWGNRYLEHTRKLVALHPCYATARNADSQLSEPLVHPSARPATWVQFDDKDQVTGHEKYTNNYKQLLDELRQGTFFTFTRFGQDGDQRQTVLISNLHNHLVAAYRTLSHSGALIRRLRAEVMILRGGAQRAGVLALVNEGKLGDYFEEVFRNAVDRLAAVLKELKKAEEEYRMASVLLNATDWDSARRFAKEGRWHLASVRYNDLLEGAPVTELNTRLLEGVATTAAAEDFLKSLREFIKSETIAGTLEAELGGIYAATPLKSSAYFLWAEIVSQHDLLVVPLIDACRKYMVAYGLRLTDDVDALLAEYHELAEACRSQLQRLDYKVEWMGGAIAPGADDAKVDAATKAFQAALDAGDKEPPSDITTQRFRDWLSADIGFAAWSRVKNAAVGSKHRNALLTSTFTGIPLAALAPKRYDPTGGFVLDLEGLFDKKQLDGCLKWCENKGKDEVSDVQKMTYCTLLAWYWADRGRLSEYRAALRAGATAAYSAAASEKKVAVSLVHRRNAISCLAASFAGLNPPAGVSVIRGGATDALHPLLMLLEREWFSSGLDASHVGRDVLQLNADIDSLSTGHDNGIDRRRSRWFFPDYIYRYGCVPDSWAAILKIGEEPAQDAPDTPWAQELSNAMEAFSKKLDEEVLTLGKVGNR